MQTLEKSGMTDEIRSTQKAPGLEWEARTFIIPKKDKIVRFFIEFREVNKRIVRTPQPIPKINVILYETKRFTFLPRYT